MCPSSRILSFLMVLLAIAWAGALTRWVGPAQARVAIAHPSFAAARPVVGPRGATPFPGPAAGRVSDRGQGGAYHRFGANPYGYDGYDLAGFGLGSLNQFGVGGSNTDYAPYPAAAPPFQARPPCVAPLLIKIGRSVRKPVTTRVVYGAPPCGS